MTNSEARKRAQERAGLCQCGMDGCSDRDQAAPARDLRADVEALADECPACHAPAGQKCRTIINGKDVGWTHDARILAPLLSDIAARHAAPEPAPAKMPSSGGMVEHMPDPYRKPAPVETPDDREALAYEILRDAARYLRKQGGLRFDLNGPHDSRGAALWDAGCAIDPDDGNALRVVRDMREGSE